MNATQCSIDGCSRPHQARGFCHTHYTQKWRAGALEELPERDLSWGALIERTKRDGDCLRWTGPIKESGYGRVSWGGKSHQVHRLAYEMNVGPIPEGMQVDHVITRGCRFRDCIRPDHLEPVTPQENVRRQSRRATDTCPNGHKYEPRPGTNWRVCNECRRERQSTRVECECGALISKNNLSVHRSRKAHKDRMENR